MISMMSNMETIQKKESVIWHRRVGDKDASWQTQGRQEQITLSADKTVCLWKRQLPNVQDAPQRLNTKKTNGSTRSVTRFQSGTAVAALTANQSAEVGGVIDEEASGQDEEGPETRTQNGHLNEASGSEEESAAEAEEDQDSQSSSQEEHNSLLLSDRLGGALEYFGISLISCYRQQPRRNSHNSMDSEV